MASDFLPDLGQHLHDRSGTARVKIRGYLKLTTIERRGDGRRSFAGFCSMGGVDCAGSFDMDPIVWADACDLLATALYLNPEAHLSSSKDSVLVLDPGLSCRIDFDVRPSEPTLSTQTGEAFTPLCIDSINEVDLVPTLDDLRQRHAWWTDQSRGWYERYEASVRTAVEESLQSASMNLKGLDYGDYLTHLIICRLVLGLARSYELGTACARLEEHDLGRVVDSAKLIDSARP